ncbi:hypothetical protein AGIG_G7957 [Arapaima gigas]
MWHNLAYKLVFTKQTTAVVTDRTLTVGRPPCCPMEPFPLWIGVPERMWATPAGILREVLRMNVGADFLLQPSETPPRRNRGIKLTSKTPLSAVLQ